MTFSSNGGPPLRRVGHKGADLIVPGNTLASFDAAVDAGVDMIEFDVLPEEGTDRLILAHDYEDACRRRVLTFEQALDHLSNGRCAGIELDVDLKLPGYEQRVVDALRERGLASRSLVCSQFVESLDRLRELAPELRLGWSVPKVRRDYTKSIVYKLPAYALLRVLARALPYQATDAFAARRCDAVMAHWRLVTPRLVDAVANAGGELYVWTVDDAARIRAFAALGVTGVISNDPRLFATT